MDATLRLAERLKRKVTNISPIDPDWVLFVIDHRSLILENSDLRIIHHENRWRYRFSIYEYLESVRRDYMQLAWIVLWLNQLGTSQDFVEDVKELYVPNLEYLQKLRKSFISSKTLFNQRSK